MTVFCAGLDYLGFSEENAEFSLSRLCRRCGAAGRARTTFAALPKCGILIVGRPIAISDRDSEPDGRLKLQVEIQSRWSQVGPGLTPANAV